MGSPEMSAWTQSSDGRCPPTFFCLRHAEPDDSRTHTPSELSLKLAEVVRLIVVDGSIHSILFDLIQVDSLAAASIEFAQATEVDINQGIKLGKDDNHGYLANVRMKEEFSVGGFDRSVRTAADTVPGVRRG